MLAYAMMAAVRSQANAMALKKSRLHKRGRSSAGQSRKSGASP